MPGWLRASSLKHLHKPYAWNCFVTAWQLTDWVWETTPTKRRNKVLKDFGGTSMSCGNPQCLRSEFHKILRYQCRALHLCQQIATGSKHKIIARYPDPDVHASPPSWDADPARAGVMRAGDPLVKYRCQLTVKDKHDTRPAPDVFIDAYKYWKDFLPKWRACLT